MNKAETEVLLERYLQGKANADEAALIERWYLKEADQQVLSDAEGFEHLRSEIWLSVRTQAGLPLQKVKPGFRFNYRYAAAALLLVTLSIGLILYVNQYNPFGSDLKITRLIGKDIAPGKNAAILTLADGKTIALSAAKQGVVINAAALTYNDGTLLSNDVPEPYEVAKRTIQISTPKGGQYEVVLPDGTRVWLNAASSLKFPGSFAGSLSREVDLSGEAYFEVAKDKSKAFKVRGSGQVVEVLGTHFNINSYEDEAGVTTTLLEGSVKVNAAVLVPGEQSILSKRGLIHIGPVAVDQVVAWKNGAFQFDETDFASIMRQLERWYDVEIKYKGAVPDIHYTGRIPRKSKISEVLEMLEETGSVRFKIDNRTVFVNKR